MKKFLMQTFFKKELSLIHDNYQRKIEDVKSSIKKEADFKLKELKKAYEIPERIFDWYEDAEIIGIERNNKNEKVFVFKDHSKSSLDIVLYGESSVGKGARPPKIKTLIRQAKNPKPHIYIQDIEMIEEGFGNGTIAMEYLIKTAEKMNASHIKGELSNIDKSNFDKLECYYEKFGFEVEFNDDRTSGEIKLKLPRS
ncbi:MULTISPECIES: hypothetical protein [Bacillus cereus group]|uniref:hypothetical protein n=1 Tax=Bacillus cereus group TaxID=86661 RepID=UPI000BF92243|nr:MULTISPECIES: hypothetical protein [Bacillus cereus group]PEZ18542.1 hypothetical protein CN337_22365 [Bacillus anthracis]PGK04928.1 hypothetical protein CN892_21590 [Bacillus anthracis]PHG45973.1 hypothetical protein COI54_16650 [Bacillus wiedmannii]